MPSGTQDLGRRVRRSIGMVGALVLALLVAAPTPAEEIGEPAFLGVTLREETDRPEGGALVTRVVPGSPAIESGLREGDIVVEFEGVVIRGPLALTQRIHKRRPGETVTVTVLRDGEELKLGILLGRRSDTVQVAPAVPPAVVVTPDEIPEVDPQGLLDYFDLSEEGYRSFLEPLVWSSKPRLGVQLVETTPELRRHLGGSDDAGVLVSKILSGLPAEKAGIQVGDLILSVDGQQVASSGDLVMALRDKVGETFDVEVVRDGRTRTIEVTIPEPDSDRPTGPRA